MKKSVLLKSIQCTDQATKSFDTSKILGKKRNAGDFETFSSIEINSASEIVLKIKIKQNDVD